MLTMPAAGILTDRMGPGKIVLTGITVIVVGMAMFTQVGVDTSYTYLLTALFVMGLGMGATMMPIMTSALQTLSDNEIARGSTLMNITQQVAASIGTALFSVLLTNGFKSSEFAGPAIASLSDPAVAAQLPPAVVAQGLADAADAFGEVFVVATVLVALCLVPAAMLPRRKPAATMNQGSGEASTTPTLMH
jgi:MFS family permease